MAKQGMKKTDRPGRPDNSDRVPEISGKAKHGHHKGCPFGQFRLAETSSFQQMNSSAGRKLLYQQHSKANPIIPGTSGAELKVYHMKPHRDEDERPISDVYPAIDTDLARDNLENDITAADLQDL